MDETEKIFNELKEINVISRKVRLKKGRKYKSSFSTIQYDPDLKGRDCITFVLIHEEGHLKRHETFAYFRLIFELAMLSILVILFFNVNFGHLILILYVFVLSYFWISHYHVEHLCDLYASMSMQLLGYKDIPNILQKALNQYPGRNILLGYIMAHPPDEKRIKFIKENLVSKDKIWTDENYETFFDEGALIIEHVMRPLE